MRAEGGIYQKWLLRSGWLIVLLAAGCVQWNTIASTSPHVVMFEVSNAAAIAGNEINLHWETEAVDKVTIEVWGFTSYEAPQIQQIASHTLLAAVGNQTITMPSAPSAVYLIVDPSVGRDQPPNATIQLHPTFYQPDMRRFAVSQTAAHPGDSLSVEWESDSLYPLQLKTSFIFETQDRSWVAPAEQFDGLSPMGDVMVTVPDSEANLVGMSFELYYRNHDYTGYMGQIMVKIAPA